MNRLLQIGWRVMLCGLLLTWVFHSIFVDYARRATPANEWRMLQRTAQWHKGWAEGPAMLWNNVKRIKRSEFTLSLILMGFTILLGTTRWQMTLRVQGLYLSFGRALEIGLVSHFFNSVMLGSTGGDLIKAYYAARETHHRKTEAVTTVFVDRILGLWCMLFFAGIMMMLTANEPSSTYPVTHLAKLIVVGMLIGCTGLLGLSFWGPGVWSGARCWLRKLPKGQYIERSLDACREFGEQRAYVAKAFLVSIILNLAIVVQWWVISQGLELNVTFKQMLNIVPIVICIAALPITPNGLGIRENLFVYMLSGSAPAGSALSISLLAYAGSLFWSVIGGGVYLLFKDRHHFNKQVVPPS